MIKINNLKKIYNQRTVVDIKNLHIPDKMIFGIVGGNGSGKSTLLKMLNGLVSPDQGQISIPIDRRQMVYLFQTPHLFNTSVYKNIASPLKFRKLPEDEIKKSVDYMIELFGLNHIRDANAKNLSGGELQKVNLARALVFKPDWIFLDEPTANIDPKSTMQIEAILSKLDMNIVLVTHNLLQAKRLCKQVAVMDEGKVVEMGSPEQALKNELLTYI